MMLNNNEFNNLESRLWREGNPLTDELTSTRDELLELLRQAQLVLEKYSPALNAFAEKDDVDYFLQWDNFTDAVDNLTYHMKG